MLSYNSDTLRRTTRSVSYINAAAVEKGGRDAEVACNYLNTSEPHLEVAREPPRAATLTRRRNFRPNIRSCDALS